MNDKFVYLLIADDLPFYVGKGTHNPNYLNKYRRFQEHLLEALKPVKNQNNTKKCKIISKAVNDEQQLDFVIVKDNLTESEAVNLERKLIKHYGRDIDGGILTNKVNTSLSVDTKRVPVYCFTTAGGFIKKFKSIKDATISSGINSGIIVNCCRGKYKTAGGLVWSYTNKFPGYTTNKNKKAKPVDCYDLDGNLLKIYDSMLDAERQTGIGQSDISKCCRQKGYTAGGFVWCYHSDQFNPPTPKTAGKPQRPVIQLSINNQPLNTFNSLKDAIALTGIKGICRCCLGYSQTAGGFKWKYKEVSK